MWAYQAARQSRDLILIQAGGVLGLLEAFLDGSAGAGDPGQVQQPGLARSVADVMGQLAGGHVAPREQPVPAAGPPADPGSAPAGLSSLKPFSKGEQQTR
jgi:hypothetical protein